MTEKPLVIFTLAPDAKFDTADIWSIMHRQEGGFDLALLDRNGGKTKIPPAMQKTAVETIAADSIGATVNEMAARLPHRIFVFTSDRACPTHDHWIKRLTGPLATGKAEAAFGREISAPGGNYFIIEQLKKRFPKDRYAAAEYFSMDNCAILKETLLSKPLPEKPLNDPPAAWRGQHGIQPAYCPEALAMRQTLLSLSEIFRQSKMEGEDARTMGTAPSLCAALANTAKGIIEDCGFALSIKKPQYLWYPFLYRPARHLGYYAGGR